MADEQQKDPRAEFLEAVTNWEREFDAQANKLMGTEGYSQWMNQMQQGQLTMQKAYSDFVTQQLRSFNMPTREDVIRNGEALRRVEQRLETLEQKMSDVLDALGQRTQAATDSSRPKRTKQPPSAAEESGDE